MFFQHYLGAFVASVGESVERAIRRRCELTARKLPVKVIGANGDPLLFRYHLAAFRGWRLCLHNIVRNDGDPDCHAHPWRRAWSFVLAGWYVEERPAPEELVGRKRCDGCGRCRRPTFYRWSGAGYRLPAFHRISEVCNHGAWTLFLHGPSVEPWGFLVNGCVVPPEEYERMRGRA